MSQKKICDLGKPTVVKQATSLSFTPDSSAAVQFGKACDPSFAEAHKLGVTQTATLIVGLNKGTRPESNTGRCAKAPAKVDLRTADAAFEAGRRGQVSKGSLAATRRAGKGWFEDAPEKSVTYEVVFVPGDPREPTYADFKKNMNALAEVVGGTLCQDSVLIVHDNGETGKRVTWEATQKDAKK